MLQLLTWPWMDLVVQWLVTGLGVLILRALKLIWRIERYRLLLGSVLLGTLVGAGLKCRRRRVERICRVANLGGRFEAADIDVHLPSGHRPLYLLGLTVRWSEYLCSKTQSWSEA